MNYKQIIKTIIDTSIKNIFVNEANEGDVYEILNSKRHRYPAVVVTPQTVNSSGTDTETLNAVLFYVDRLTDTQENKLSIQSQGMSVLRQIIDKCGDTFTVENYTFTPFTEKFTDECAGVFVNINVNYPVDFICADDELFVPKVLNINKNGKYNVTGYDEADVEVLPLPVQQKQITITKDGTYEIKPDDGYLLDKVEVDVNILEDEEFHLLTRQTDTGITLASDYKIEFEFVPVKPYNTSSAYATFLSNRTFKEQNQDCAQVYYTIAYGKIGAGVTSEGGTEIAPYTDGLIKMVLVSNSKEHYAECYINDVFQAKRDFQSTGYTPIDNTIHIAGAKNKSVAAPLLFYSLKIYKNDVLVFDGKPKIDKSIGVHYLINAVNNQAIDASTYNLDSIATIELSEATQTITVTNEEYEAIAPILSEIRGE